MRLFNRYDYSFAALADDAGIDQILVGGSLGMVIQGGKNNFEAETAGAFSVVLEGSPEEIATKITQTLKIPTIGIGAGLLCDGQIMETVL